MKHYGSIAAVILLIAATRCFAQTAWEVNHPQGGDVRPGHEQRLFEMVNLAGNACASYLKGAKNPQPEIHTQFKLSHDVERLGEKGDKIAFVSFHVGDQAGICAAFVNLSKKRAVRVLPEKEHKTKAPNKPNGE